MKKMSFMRMAALMLLLCLASTCAISGTFAKYTTEATGTSTARVAYWGFTDGGTIEITNLFATSYTGVGNNTNVVSNTDNIIAPGSTNSATFAFDYTDNTGKSLTAPEVAYSFVVSTEGSAIADDIKSNPNIQWKLDTGEWGTWDDMITAIENLDGNKDYEPNELPTAFAAGSEHIVSWQWIFETADDADPDNGSEEAIQDGKDTAMGNKQTLDTVTLKITITATQID